MATQIPFTVGSGRFLDRALTAAGLAKADIFTTNGWRAMKANLDDWEKCITEARAQMATGNSSKFDECDEISSR